MTSEDGLAVFDKREDAAESLTAPEIADAVGIARRTALNRLDDLRERSDIASKKVGGRAHVWWVSDELSAPAAPLKQLVGMLNDDEADELRERTREVREGFDDRIERTRRKLDGKTGSSVTHGCKKETEED